MNTIGNIAKKIGRVKNEPVMTLGEALNFDKLLDKHYSEIVGQNYSEAWHQDPKTKALIFTLCRYFMGVENFDIDGLCKISKANPNKGLLITGDIGVGKSVFFNVIHRIGKELGTRSGRMLFPKTSAPFFVREYMASTQTGYFGNFDFAQFLKGRLYIDDLGAEELCFGRYELLTELLFERHSNNALTFATSNLTRQELGMKYGARVADRFHEMFNFFEWEGNSLRS